jgi:hypothetical protein
MLPKTQLSERPPATLNGNPHARATWSRLIELYGSLDGTLVTAFDENVLVLFCKVESVLAELLTLRAETKKQWVHHSKILAKMKPKPDQFKNYFNALAACNALLQRYQGLDARADGKRKLLHDLARSLYLSPRSRVGVSPQEKPPKEPPDEMTRLLEGSD